MRKLILFALVLALVSLTCELETPQFATVTFEDPVGNNTVEPVTVQRGTSLGVKMPNDFEKTGYIFYGWFDDSGTQYFPSTPIGTDITLSTRWSEIPEYATVTFAFNQADPATGNPIESVFPIPPITIIKGQPLGLVGFPVKPRAQGWDFDKWSYGGEEFTPATPITDDITVTASWTAKTLTYRVTFDPGPGVTPVPAPRTVYAGECIDEWTVRFPANPATGSNPINDKAFFVAWLDDENREYTGRTPITRAVKITGRWGLPPYIVDFDKDIEKVKDWGGARGDLEPAVMDAWDSTPANPKRVIVNTKTYDVPTNAGRWEILYQLTFKWPSTFSTGFYTRYTIRGRFYANRQGAGTWKTDPLYDEGAFIPNVPKLPVSSGYKKDGLLVGTNSPSNDGWGQISWTLTEAATGVGADATTMLQRYNLDRKGGTINDTWVPGNGKDLKAPPYLLIQTSDNFIGHIEVTQIVFHNGEKKYTMYEDEEGYDDAVDGITIFEPETP